MPVEVLECGIQDLDLRFGVWGLGLKVQGVGFRVQGSGFMVWGLEFGLEGLGFGVEGLRFRVQGAGLRVEGVGVGVRGLGFGGKGVEIERECVSERERSVPARNVEGEGLLGPLRLERDRRPASHARIDQIAFFNCLDLHRSSPESGALRAK